MTSILVRYTGEEESFEMPVDIDAYLEAASRVFFKDGLPTIDPLTFDPAAARAAIDEKRGGVSAEPKTRGDLIAALLTLPGYVGKEAELKKIKRVSDLRELWRSRQGGGAESPATSGDSDSDSDPTGI